MGGGNPVIDHHTIECRRRQAALVVDPVGWKSSLKPEFTHQQLLSEHSPAAACERFRDRSWDLSLSLDGTVGRGRRPANRPLVDLVRRLPSLSAAPLPVHVESLVEDLADDLQRTDWSLPVPFEAVAFAVNGLRRRVWSPSACSRMAIISPFCDADALKMLADPGCSPFVPDFTVLSPSRNGLSRRVRGHV